ncbi:MAG: prepilin-type N-terminal cleavage/methylation domain-containing protein [Planctomycetes bacterium]|nr:prepilin-type N-terminal cleavage/methylation domain-containing protein [Planctomycetota bacterium]
MSQTVDKRREIISRQSPQAAVRRRCSRDRHGFTLIELLIVVALVGIFVGAMIPRLEPGNAEQLEGAAQILSADLAYARNLAVSHGSNYELTFSLDANRYVLQHSGTNSFLDTLPPSAFKSPNDPATEQSTDLDDLPHIGQAASIVAVQKLTPGPVNVSDVEFGELGETTRSEPTVIWLRCGAGADTIYLSVTVDPVTGLTSIGDIQSDAPPSPSPPLLPSPPPAAGS